MVRNTRGRPVADARVMATSFATGWRASTRTDRQGRFRLVAPRLPFPAASSLVRLQVSAGAARAQKVLDVPAGRVLQAGLVLGASRAPAVQAGLLESFTATPVPSCPGDADTWTNGTGTGMWEAPGNWSSGGLPSSSSYVCIPAGAGAVQLQSSPTIDGLLLETGSVLTETAGTLTIDGGSVPSALQGTLNIASGATTVVGSTGEVTNASGGQTNNAGSLVVQGIFEQDAGQVAGASPVDLQSGSLLDIGGTGAGAFEVYQDPVPTTPVTVSLSGDLAAGQSLTAYAECYSSGYGNIVVNATGSFTNAGPWLWSTSAAATAARSP